MTPEKIFKPTGLRRLYNDLKAEAESLKKENDYLRNELIKAVERQNKLIEKCMGGK